MADSKQCADYANTGGASGTKTEKLTPSDPKAPALKGATETNGVPTSKQGRE